MSKSTLTAKMPAVGADASAELPTTQPWLYRSSLSRRDSLKLFAALAASSVLPACDSPAPAVTKAASDLTPAAVTRTAAPWPMLKLAGITAPGYGKDPSMLMPPPSPWPLTLTPTELTKVAQLADLIMPATNTAPAASERKVPEVINEWVSAPYEQQQADRAKLLSLLKWLDDETALRQTNTSFGSAPAELQHAILTDIAFDSVNEGYAPAADAFNRLRSLVVAAYYATPEGHKEIGYLGNTAIAGDYPGPTPEAKAHLVQVLQQLGLSEFAYNA